MRRVRRVLVQRQGRPTFEFDLSAMDLALATDGMNQLKAAAHAQVVERKRHQMIPDNRHEARNFG